ncbi:MULTISPECIES: MFS transporter [unclassified Streptomyces]|uniref:MFS transporter n=1 Tax=unclassified Streptomyces TaxID=2593676 RepID=UPI000FB78B54|nr:MULTISPECIES: MFS transporter [unclassified Streptomyces]RPK59214.1 Major Facilitator Superfamily protein [Streptomyces sp. ADI95-17]WSC32957.1 MFS transporter [Streptomyces sp. NBC_01768]WSG55491.1 MFS transporter [Streptomyces sp. NBC_01732]WSX06630.1 MFS transporter [Streptomyces sp. NBC_00987]
MKTNSGPALTFAVAAALIAGFALGSSGSNVMPVFVDDFADRFDLSSTSAGLVAASQLMAVAIATLLLANRAARPGRVRMARGGLALAAAGFIGAAIAFDILTLIAASLLLGAGLGAVYAASTAAMAGAGDDADKTSSITITGALFTSALLLLAVPAVNESAGGGTGFFLLAVCCLPGWFLVGHLPDGPGPASSPSATAPSAASRPARPSAVLLVGAGLLMAVTQGVWSYASLLGRGHTGMSASALSAVLAISSVVALAGAIAGPLAVKRFGRLRSMTGFVVVEAFSTGLLIVTHSPTLFIATAVVWQTCWLAVLVQILAAASVIDSTGRWVAALSGAGALGAGIGPLAVGAIMDNMGVGVLSILLTAGTLIAALPLLKMTASSDAAADTTSVTPHPQATPIARTTNEKPASPAE